MTSSPGRSFAERLRTGSEPLLGTFVQLPSSDVVDVVASAALDFVILDNEHGPIALDGLGNLLRAAGARGTPALVRLANDDPASVQKALDLGAGGVLVPHVASREQAQEVVSAASFAPRGTRGACPCVRALDYGRDETAQTYADADDGTVVVLAIEGVDGVANAEEIAGVQGVDAVLLGPVDLSHSLGVPGRPDHPLVRDAITRTVERLRNVGVAVGVFSFTAEEAAGWAAAGARLLPVGVDSMLLQATYGRLAAAFHERVT